MRPSSSFARGVAFAALAAATWLPWAVLVGPVIGLRSALAFYLVGATAAYVYSLSPRAGSRAVAGVLVFAAASAAAFVAQTASELAVGLAVIVGVARVVLHPAAPARTIVREAVLLVAGLLLARLLAGPSLASIALAVWAFLLVQSFFFLGGGRRPLLRAQGDAFEEARRRALALLEEA